MIRRDVRYSDQFRATSSVHINTLIDYDLITSSFFSKTLHTQGIRTIKMNCTTKLTAHEMLTADKRNW